MATLNLRCRDIPQICLPPFSRESVQNKDNLVFEGCIYPAVVTYPSFCANPSWDGRSGCDRRARQADACVWIHRRRASLRESIYLQHMKTRNADIDRAENCQRE